MSIFNINILMNVYTILRTVLRFILKSVKIVR
jgi:hypothetical protein